MNRRERPKNIRTPEAVRQAAKSRRTDAELIASVEEVLLHELRTPQQPFELLRALQERMKWWQKELAAVETQAIGATTLAAKDEAMSALLSLEVKLDRLTTAHERLVVALKKVSAGHK